MNAVEAGLASPCATDAQQAAATLNSRFRERTSCPLRPTPDWRVQVRCDLDATRLIGPSCVDLRPRATKVEIDLQPVTFTRVSDRQQRTPCADAHRDGDARFAFGVSFELALGERPTQSTRFEREPAGSVERPRRRRCVL